MPPRSSRPTDEQLKKAKSTFIDNSSSSDTLESFPDFPQQQNSNSWGAWFKNCFPKSNPNSSISNNSEIRPLLSTQQHDSSSGYYQRFTNYIWNDRTAKQKKWIIAGGITVGIVLVGGIVVMVLWKTGHLLPDHGNNNEVSTTTLTTSSTSNVTTTTTSPTTTSTTTTKTTTTTPTTTTTTKITSPTTITATTVTLVPATTIVTPLPPSLVRRALGVSSDVVVHVILFPPITTLEKFMYKELEFISGGIFSGLFSSGQEIRVTNQKTGYFSDIKVALTDEQFKTFSTVIFNAMQVGYTKDQLITVFNKISLMKAIPFGDEKELFEPLLPFAAAKLWDINSAGTRSGGRPVLRYIADLILADTLFFCI